MRRALLALTLAASLAAAQPTLFDRFRAFLAPLWGDTGCHIDPNGCPAPRTDEGCHIDPDGRCGA